MKIIKGLIGPPQNVLGFLGLVRPANDCNTHYVTHTYITGRHIAVR